MPFPEDLADILPLLPGDKVVRRLNLDRSVILVEIEGTVDSRYNLHINVYCQGEMIRIFGVDSIQGEEAVGVIWRQFLDERKAILANHRLN